MNSVGGLWWWLSYADDDGFNGAIICKGNDLIDAVTQCKRMGLDLHGQVLGVPFPSGLTPPSMFVERILSKSECDAFGEVMSA